MTKKAGWQWWAGDNEEMFSVGPYSSKKEAIAEAIGQCTGEFEGDDGKWRLGIHVVEARHDPLRLADWIGADRLLERVEEDIFENDTAAEDYVGPYVNCTPEQEADLVARVRRVCDDWQAENGVVISMITFTATRNADYIVVDHPDMQVAA